MSVHHHAWHPDPEPTGRVNPDIDLDELDPSGRSRRRAAAAAGRGRGRRAARGRRALRWTAAGASGVLLSVAALGGYLYVRFDRNIKSAPLLPNGVTQAPEVPNEFGQTAMNILLLGNAGRVSAADCSLGGACDDTATSADSMMVLHLSADRSNMTVMSIPRDSIVDLPACAGESRDLINASLVHGASCSVQTVHDLTGLTIDHFIEIDMAGVVTMSDAVGGVPVCVTNNVYDDYSHLKLPKGTSTIEGTQALAWIRTRHAFINEVYREQAQHMFLAALMRKLKDNASFTHITTLYSVADAATKSLTVDPALSSVTDLLSLAQELGKTPTDRITFMSVPTVPYTGTNAAWQQQLQFDEPAADQMFGALKADRAYTAGSAASSSGAAGSASSASSAATAQTPQPVDTALVHAEIQNASGISGRAATVRDGLTAAGFASANLTVGNALQSSSTTAVYYPSDRADSAQAVAAALGIPSSAVHESSTYSQVTVVIGGDWASGATYGASTATSASPGAAGAAAVAPAPPSSSLVTNGGDSKACMYVPSPEW
jgi:LCP family protein required for cell wall assembly